MSIHLDVENLPEILAERGPAAYLVTVRETRPHVVAVEVSEMDGLFLVAPGRRTAMNIAEHPDVTLLWPTDENDPKHSLLVDGVGSMSADGEFLEIRPTSAVLHRVGGRRRLPPKESSST
ncbi:MAG: pyridoxamine 5'-phosphate oxidase family protein [Acidimicrobiales bacterium]|nr:pyridoxamine 5'-phosphate oxidase family protein [Acidimicrobiales bacterium]